MGMMLNTLRGAIYTPALAHAAGFCIFLTSIGFQHGQRWLRTAMDVRA